MSEEILEDICSKFNRCKDCPLLIKSFNLPDSDYDNHSIYVCYKKEYNKIRQIELYISLIKDVK